MPANNSPAFFVKGNGKEKWGSRFAGFEPDSLAGVIGFAIPPQKV